MIVFLTLTALFLIRDNEFIESLPNNLKENFMESTEEGSVKLELLKNCIKGRFPVRFTIFIYI